MQMGFDFQDGAHGPGLLAESGGFAGGWGLLGRVSADGFAPGGRPGAPDWAGLKARFAALHALRRSFDSSPLEVIPAGSFTAAGEAVLAATRGSVAVVNRICSGNGKAAAGMIALLSPTVPREATEDTND